jgi:uncharacterized protein (UPF0212 family)
MDINEKAAYIKGLADGLKLSSDNPSDKLTLNIIDLLKDLCEIVTDVDEDLNLAFEELEEIHDKLGLDDDDFDDDDDEELYELKCPKCGETIYLSFDEMSGEDMSCPACGEPLDIELIDDDDDDDGCCCEECKQENDK